MPKSEKIKINVKERVEDNVIDLSLSELSEIPVKEIAFFKRVTVLDLSNNKLTNLGKTFPSLTRLTKLDLSKNEIKYLPENFGDLRNLRHLDLYNNKLSHLPLSFGNLVNLRYLDLKTNPLTPKLAKIVGLCITAKDCQLSAKNTVQFLARMQDEVIKTKEKLQQESDAQLEALEEIKTENQKPKKAKKLKSKAKKVNDKDDGNAVQHQHAASANHQSQSNRSSNRNSNGSASSDSNPSTALATIFIFFILLAINIAIIYLITFKNPDIAEKLVEFIPHQYRDWILTKSEIFRLRVSDLIQEFRTPPEDN